MKLSRMRVQYEAGFYKVERADLFIREEMQMQEER